MTVDEVICQSWMCLCAHIGAPMFKSELYYARSGIYLCMSMMQIIITHMSCVTVRDCCHHHCNSDDDNGQWGREPHEYHHQHDDVHTSTILIIVLITCLGFRMHAVVYCIRVGMPAHWVSMITITKCTSSYGS